MLSKRILPPQRVRQFAAGFTEPLVMVAAVEVSLGPAHNTMDSKSCGEELCKSPPVKERHLLPWTTLSPDPQDHLEAHIPVMNEWTENDSLRRATREVKS